MDGLAEELPSADWSGSSRSCGCCCCGADELADARGPEDADGVQRGCCCAEFQSVDSWTSHVTDPAASIRCRPASKRIDVPADCGSTGAALRKDNSRDPESSPGTLVGSSATDPHLFFFYKIKFNF